MASGQGQQDYNDTLLYFILAIVLLAVATWWFGRNSPAIHAAIMHIARLELAPVALVSNEAAFVREAVAKMDPASATTSQVFAQLAYAGKYYAWPLTLVVGFLMLKSWSLSAADKFRRSLNMRSLMENNRKSHPSIAPVLNWPRSLLDEPPDEGPWMVARQPIQFVAEHGLFVRVDDETSVVSGEHLLGADNLADPHSPVLSGNPAVKLSRAKARFVFEQQFGPLYAGFTNLPQYLQKLSLAFLLFGAEDKEAAYRLLDSMSMSFHPWRDKKTILEKCLCRIPTSFYGKAQKQITKNKHPQWILDISHDIPQTRICGLMARKDVMRMTGMHDKYVNLFVLSLYEFARTKGVLPTADFIWLRPVNRKLFYLLNNFGRRTAWVEIAGPWTHYQAEELAMRTIPGMPGAGAIEQKMVTEAVNALEIAMYEEGWISPTDLSKECRQGRIFDD
jgi:hypothetical protein